MPLDVRIKSQRPHNRPGESYRAVVDLSNAADASDCIYVIEGVSVKCHGVEVLDPGWVAAPYYTSTPGPAYRQDGRRVVRTLFSAHSSQILERLVFLAPGQGKQFGVVCPLPEKLPPSFRGTSVRYLYEVLVGVKYRKAAYGERGSLRKTVESQEPLSLAVRKVFYVFPDYFDSTQLNNKTGCEEGEGDEVPMLDVCFRSLDEVALQWSEISDDDKTSSTEGSIPSRIVSEGGESASTAMRLGMSASRATGYARSVSRISVSRSSLPETEVSSYTHPVCRRAPSLTHAEAQMLIGTCMRPQLFNLRFGSETVVLFSFNPSMARPLRPGSTLGGVLRLSGMERNGYQQDYGCQSYTVMLETEEEVAEEWQPGTPQMNRVIRHLHCEHTEFTGDVFMTNFMFTIPSIAPPSFKTPLVSLRWVLKFEFEVGRSVEWAETGDMHQSTEETEPLIWQLPLTVYPQ